MSQVYSIQHNQTFTSWTDSLIGFIEKYLDFNFVCLLFYPALYMYVIMSKILTPFQFFIGIHSISLEQQSLSLASIHHVHVFCFQFSSLTSIHFWCSF